MVTIPRIVVAGTHSGCGKTTVARGIMEAFSRRGLRVQPFKVGPDFIDPTHHTAICGRTSRNLDPFMMGEEGVRQSFLSAVEGADIAVIEGVMGMFDGLDGGDRASTAHVMRILSCPALLVVDARGMSRSAHAVVKGFKEFEPGIWITGVVFNRVGSARHRELIEAGRTAPAFGFIPRSSDLQVASRHLGLEMAHETAPAPRLGNLIEEHCDVAGILGAAADAPELSAPARATIPKVPEVRIGVARDPAFCFYYQDNLDLLARSGASILWFSPMSDPFPDVDALYLGGGYPELHASALETSHVKAGLKKAAGEGLPVYAECGGLLYLGESLSTDREFRMAGILPLRGEMTGRIQALGYSDGTWSEGPGLAAAGNRILGHEFHYSRVEYASDARFSIRLTRGKGIRDGRDGIFEGEALGTYTHAYFSPAFAESFLRAATRYRRT